MDINPYCECVTYTQCKLTIFQSVVRGVFEAVRDEAPDLARRQQHATAAATSATRTAHARHRGAPAARPARNLSQTQTEGTLKLDHFIPFCF